MHVPKALNVNADALLGIEPVKTSSVGSQLERQIRKIEKQGSKPQQQIAQPINTFIEAEQLK